MCATVGLLALGACDRQRHGESMTPIAEIADTDDRSRLIRLPTPVDLRGIGSLSDLADAAEATLWGDGERTTTLCLRSARCSPVLAERIAELDLVSDLGFTGVECENHQETFAARVGVEREARASLGWSRILRIEISGTEIAMHDVNCSAERLTTFVTDNHGVLSDQGFSAVRCGHYLVDLAN